MLFDTDIFIWAQRGNPAAARAIENAPQRFISVQTYMEFLQGARNRRELALTQSFLQAFSFETLGFTEEIGHRAAIYIETFGLSHGLLSADAIVAATAVENGLTLLSSNAKHFRAIPGLKLKIFRP